MQGTGKICLREPISENGRCAVHGGRSSGAKTEEGREKALSNLNPKANLIHGVYS
ncbi:HGGxSTG domain-containing protein [Bacillus atrophaeus]|uniref:HGGxSTG domain-containing protein n=1 Tax=Bacillus atrophaeus TaxID=1452 RepID=UPI0028121B11|nr:HGGxSTG domain-containing protein [Bacillus atrophaeus]MED4805815.1 HGGxSTG domain-containing protein [Bacillus atrophaeus]MED4817599.1 HGGxSTG domain-containing protein [Bacillus atrophaeus]MED4825764.1 HGGxSTG domain-containing protein [Bacillus atrophaeus]MED4844654.1 HGGxSTG domain-containing protein [Bacillus atrophaeus]